MQTLTIVWDQVGVLVVHGHCAHGQLSSDAIFEHRLGFFRSVAARFRRIGCAGRLTHLLIRLLQYVLKVLVAVEQNLVEKVHRHLFVQVDAHVIVGYVRIIDIRPELVNGLIVRAE